MIRIRTAIALAFVILAASASAQAQRAARAAADYFPLRVGDSWKYRMSDGSTEYTVKILSEEKQADGTSRYLLEKLASVKINQWLSKQEGTVLMHREAYPEHEGLEMKHDPAKVVLKYPLTPGAKWTWRGKNVTQTELEESNTVGRTEVVVVPAGRFRAVKVVSRVSDGESLSTKTYWYADGVGLVKWTSEGTTPAGHFTYAWELVDYSFKKKPAR